MSCGYGYSKCLHQSQPFPWSPSPGPVTKASPATLVHCTALHFALRSQLSPLHANKCGAANAGPVPCLCPRDLTAPPPPPPPFIADCLPPLERLQEFGLFNYRRHDLRALPAAATCVRIMNPRLERGEAAGEPSLFAFPDAWRQGAPASRKGNEEGSPAAGGSVAGGSEGSAGEEPQLADALGRLALRRSGSGASSEASFLSAQSSLSELPPPPLPNPPTAEGGPPGAALLERGGSGEGCSLPGQQAGGSPAAGAGAGAVCGAPDAAAGPSGEQGMLGSGVEAARSSSGRGSSEQGGGDRREGQAGGLEGSGAGASAAASSLSSSDAPDIAAAGAAGAAGAPESGEGGGSSSSSGGGVAAAARRVRGGASQHHHHHAHLEAGGGPGEDGEAGESAHRCTDPNCPLHSGKHFLQVRRCWAAGLVLSTSAEQDPVCC